MEIQRITLLDRFGERLVEQEGGWFCHYCQREIRRMPYTRPAQATVDHIIPQSQGGRTAMDNLVLACYHCNTTKGSKDYLEFWKSKQKQRIDTLVKRRKAAKKGKP